MRNFILLTAAFVALTPCAPAVATTTFTTAQYAKAAAAIAAMKKLNLLTFGDATLHSDVEGKVYVGGNLTGNSATIDKGGSGSYTHDPIYRALTVGGNLINGVNINNGIGLSAIEAVIGGNAGGINVNLGSAGSAKVMVGGTFNAQNFNPNSKKTATYGVAASGLQTQDAAYVKKDAALGNATTGLRAGIAAVTASYQAEMTTLSSILGALSPTATLVSSDQNNIHFDFTPAAATAPYAVANVTAGQLASGTFVMPTYAAAKTLIINVSGTTVNLGANPTGSTTADQQNVIWNFTDATTVNVNTALFGSVLAPKATIKGNSPINGSVVANLFQSNGEVHLGTFNGNTSFLVTAVPNSGGVPPVSGVPEPASWMTMLLGFGAMGTILRRRRPGRSTAV